MCEPATLATIAIATSAVSAGAGVVASNRQTELAQRQAENRAEETAAARDEEIGQRVREARRLRSTLQVSAGEAGVAGNSFEAQLRNIAGQTNQDVAVIQKQAGFTERGLNSIRDSQVGNFGALNAGLQIAGSTADALGRLRIQRAANGP
ncbi:MAG: hypothetical protein AAF628_08350 [Planctomycetota bacterium]